jgi:hypothetical protein
VVVLRLVERPSLTHGVHARWIWAWAMAVGWLLVKVWLEWRRSTPLKKSRALPLLQCQAWMPGAARASTGERKESHRH